MTIHGAIAMLKSNSQGQVVLLRSSLRGARALRHPVTVTEGPQKIFFNIQTKTYDVECLT